MSTVLPEGAALPAAPVLPLLDELLEQPAAARAAIATAASAGPNFLAFKLVSSSRFTCPVACRAAQYIDTRQYFRERSCLW
jgi:hypothetical protein